MSDDKSIRDSDRWTEGDMTLISSDRVRFRVPSSLLSWGSSVLADMFKLPEGDGGEAQAQTIELSNSFEDSKTIDAFLFLLSRVELPFQVGSTQHDGRKHRYKTFGPLLKNLLAFMDKYDSERGVSLLAACGAKHDLHGTWAVEDAFLFGALINDPVLCKKSFDYHHYFWKNPPETFTSSTVPYDYYAALPRPYFFALVAADQGNGRALDKAKFSIALDDALKS